MKSQTNPNIAIVCIVTVTLAMSLVVVHHKRGGRLQSPRKSITSVFYQQWYRIIDEATKS